MSDLSGSGVVSGFEQYITGYPLDSISAYALAMTWYAPEMPRPGCVWTHTLAIPVPLLATISSLISLTNFFKRPARNLPQDQYAETLSFNDDSMHTNSPKRDLKSNAKVQFATIFSAYYGSSSRFRPVVLVARDSDEFADAIFALWSQQWPALRQNFAFCTGSLSGRTIAGRAFERSIRAEGKRISDKYIDPPATLPHAIMFLPTENLYAEVVRRPGLQSEIQSSCRVTIAGPSTFMAILTSFQMGFHTMAIQKKGDEVWKVLSSAKNEFEKFGGLMDKVEKQVGTVQNTLRELGGKTRTINRALRNVSSTDIGAPTTNLIAFEELGGIAPLLAAGGDAEDE